MYYQEYGGNNSSALVLLHSGGMAGVEWQPQIDAFSQNFHLFVPDLLGHGQSLVPIGESLSISLMAEAVIEMLDEKGIEKAHFLGSSMGGAVALWLALNHPHRVDKLIIYRIGYSKNKETHSQTQNMANPEYWRQYGMHSWLSRLHSPQGGEDAWEAVIANVSRVLDPATSEHHHTLEDLSTIRAKTLLIAGDNDPLIPVETLLEMYHAIPDCAMWVMPNATHITASNTWRAKSFSEEVIRFLR